MTDEWLRHRIYKQAIHVHFHAIGLELLIHLASIDILPKARTRGSTSARSSSAQGMVTATSNRPIYGQGIYTNS